MIFLGPILIGFMQYGKLNCCKVHFNHFPLASGNMLEGYFFTHVRVFPSPVIINLPESFQSLVIINLPEFFQRVHH